MRPPTEENWLEHALDVVKYGENYTTGEPHDKMLYFLLHDGECDAEITNSEFTVRYSWRLISKPSSYFPRLAPGTLRLLMDLGGIEAISKEAKFEVGPGTTGTGRYGFDFEKKWVLIEHSSERITVKVRNNRWSFLKALKRNQKSAWCPNCRQELRTPLAKQCLHCGHDWH